MQILQLAPAAMPTEAASVVHRVNETDSIFGVPDN